MIAGLLLSGLLLVSVPDMPVEEFYENDSINTEALTESTKGILGAPTDSGLYANIHSESSVETITSVLASVPLWSANTTYWEGDKVIYNNKVYEAKWWIIEEPPDSSDAWKLLGEFVGGDSDSENPIIEEPIEYGDKVIVLLSVMCMLLIVMLTFLSLIVGFLISRLVIGSMRRVSHE